MENKHELIVNTTSWTLSCESCMHSFKLVNTVTSGRKDCPIYRCDRPMSCQEAVVGGKSIGTPLSNHSSGVRNLCNLCWLCASIWEVSVHYLHHVGTCMYVYVYICMFVYLLVCLTTYFFIFNLFIYVYIYICVCVDVCICIFVCMCVCQCTVYTCLLLFFTHICQKCAEGIKVVPNLITLYLHKQPGQCQLSGPIKVSSSLKVGMQGKAVKRKARSSGSALFFWQRDSKASAVSLYQILNSSDQHDLLILLTAWILTTHLSQNPVIRFCSTFDSHDKQPTSQNIACQLKKTQQCCSVAKK